MLNLNEYLKLEELKGKLCNQIGVVDTIFSEEQLLRIFQEIEKYPEGQRTKTVWQQVVTLTTGYRSFSTYEALEFSDINFVHKQIQQILSKK